MPDNIVCRKDSIFEKARPGMINKTTLLLSSDSCKKVQELIVKDKYQSSAICGLTALGHCEKNGVKQSNHMLHSQL